MESNQNPKRKVLLDALQKPVKAVTDALMPEVQDLPDLKTPVPQVDTRLPEFKVDPIEMEKQSPSIDVGATLSEWGKGIKETYEKDPSAWLLGATPILVGYLTGGVEEGYKVAGKALTDEAARRREDAKDDLAYARKLKLARETASKKESKRKLQEKTLMGKGDNRKYAALLDPETGVYYSPRTGEPLDMSNYIKDISAQEKEDIKTRGITQRDEIMGKNFSVKKDSQGRDVLFNRRTQTFTPLDTRKFAPKQLKFIDDKVDKYNKATAKDRENLRNLEVAYANLTKPNQLANKLAIMSFVKDIEQKLSDYDRTYYTQEISDKDRLKERVRKMGENEVNPRLLQDAINLTSSFIKKTKNKLKDNRSRFSSQIRSRVKDATDEEINNFLGTQVEPSDIPVEYNGEIMYIPIEDLEQAIKDGAKPMRM